MRLVDLDGFDHHLSDYAGNPVLLAYFATFLPVCSLEFPDLETAFWQKYRDRGLVVIGVAQGGLRGEDTDQILREFIAQTGVTFLIARDVEASYGLFIRSVLEPMISPFPLDVVLDREGRLVSARGEYDPAALTAKIEALLQ